MRLSFSYPIIAAIVLLPCVSSMGQTAKQGAEWAHLSALPASKTGAERLVRPLRGEYFQLNSSLLRDKLARVALREPSAAKISGAELELPMPDGKMARFVIVEAPVMAPELAVKFPEIKTYAGQGIDDPSATVRLDLTPLGFHAQVLSLNGAVYVDPAYRGDSTLYVSYFKHDLQKGDDWQCLTVGSDIAGKDGAGKGSSSGVAVNKVQSGATLRTYRLAVACTGEYAAYFGGTVPLALSAIVSAVNRVDGVYETELAVRMILVANNDLVVYTDANTDPYSNGSGSTMLGQNQTTMDSIIGPAKYDIGHVFSTGGGGVAYLRAVCASNKAGGVTGSSAPSGDAFWIDYVAHEMGHQFGGNHTFNSGAGSCSGNRNASTAFEPGSGVTIMAYAGICSSDDLQPHSDPYFHAGSLDEIQTFLAGSGGGCAENSATGNNPPTVNAGANYTIPSGTPFVLTASGSDPDGDALTYIWEEMDAGATAALTTSDNGTMALFRNFPPASTPVRFFPKLTSVLANTNWNQEKLPATSRTMKFRVTARDNRVGGGVADAQITVTSVSGSGAFAVTSPNTAVNWSGVRTVTWNVAGSASAPINTPGVNIYLSTDGGLSFPFMLATNVPNIGSATIVLPNVTSTQARIKVEGAGNIFYDVSDVNFSVIPGSDAPLIFLAGTELVAESCFPTNGAVDPYETVTVNWSLVNYGNSPTTNLVARLVATNGAVSAVTDQNYGAIPPGGTVTRPFTFTLAGICGGSATGIVQLVDGTNDLGLVSAVFSLGAVQTTVSTQVFNNAGPITIRDNTSALPYPSTIAVSGISAPVTKVTATINGWSHSYPGDVSMLLVGPGGQKVKLAGRAGGGTAVNGVTLTFDDAAGNSLSSSSISSGTYLPTEVLSSGVFSSPAPAAPYGNTLAPLAATPNGTWSLYVQDFAAVDTGSISGGWSLRFITATSTTNCCDTSVTPTLTSTTYDPSSNVVKFSWNATPGMNYQVQYSTNLIDGSWLNLGAPIPGTNSILGITDEVGSAPIRFYRLLVLP